MGLIGRQETTGAFVKLDNISSLFNGNATAFNLTLGGVAFFPDNPLTLLVSVGGVVQEPATAYTIVDSQIIFTTPPANAASGFIVVLSTPSSLIPQAFKSLSVGQRSGITKIDLQGKNFSVKDRYGAIINIALNVA